MSYEAERSKRRRRAGRGTKNQDADAAGGGITAVYQLFCFRGISVSNWCSCTKPVNNPLVPGSPLNSNERRALSSSARGT
jgi:hypothetical protein